MDQEKVKQAKMDPERTEKFVRDNFATLQWRGTRGTQEDAFIVGELPKDALCSSDSLMNHLKTKISSFDDPDSSGSTAVVVIAKSNGDLEVSHLGDSAACLISVLDNGEVTFELLTQNIHNCNNNQEWSKLGALEASLSDGLGRRVGGLNLSRCFGQQDSFYLKNDSQKKVEDLTNFCTTHETLVMADMQSLPKVQRRLVIIFTDGLYCTLDKATLELYTVDDVLPKAIQEAIRKHAKAPLEKMTTEIDETHKKTEATSFDNNTFTLLDVTTPPERTLVACVFDGNLGDQCSEFLKNEIRLEILRQNGVVMYSSRFVAPDVIPASFNRYMLLDGPTPFCTSMNREMKVFQVTQMRLRNFIKYTAEEYKNTHGCVESDIIGFNIPQDPGYYVELYFSSTTAFIDKLAIDLKQRNILPQNRDIGMIHVCAKGVDCLYASLKLTRDEAQSYLDIINMSRQDFDEVIVKGEWSPGTATSHSSYQAQERERRAQSASSKTTGNSVEI